MLLFVRYIFREFGVRNITILFQSGAVVNQALTPDLTAINTGFDSEIWNLLAHIRYPKIYAD